MMDGNAEICCAGGALGMEENNRIVRSWSGNCVRLSLLLRRLVDTAQRWLLLVSVLHVGNNFAADRNMIIYVLSTTLNSCLTSIITPKASSS